MISVHPDSPYNPWQQAHGDHSPSQRMLGRLPVSRGVRGSEAVRESDTTETCQPVIPLPCLPTPNLSASPSTALANPDLETATSDSVNHADSTVDTLAAMAFCLEATPDDQVAHGDTRELLPPSQDPAFLSELSYNDNKWLSIRKPLNLHHNQHLFRFSPKNWRTSRMVLKTSFDMLPSLASLRVLFPQVRRLFQGELTAGYPSPEASVATSRESSREALPGALIARATFAFCSKLRILDGRMGSFGELSDSYECELWTGDTESTPELHHVAAKVIMPDYFTDPREHERYDPDGVPWSVLTSVAEFEQELKNYCGFLSSLQGVVIPRFYGYFTGPMATDLPPIFPRIEGCLALFEWAGRALRTYDDLRALTWENKVAIFKLYRALHDRRILHYNVSAAHICRDGDSFRLVDFKHTCLAEPGEEGDKEILHEWFQVARELLIKREEAEAIARQLDQERADSSQRDA